jgi:Uncharacterized conserved protein (DUF2190)
MSLASMLALLADNTTGDISAADARTVVTELFERTDGTIAIESLMFDTTSPDIPGVHTPGHAHWNTTEGMLEIMSSTTGVTLQLGHEQWIEVRNNSGATILNGRPVRITGGIATRPTVALDNGLGGIVGVATHDIPNNSNGKITSFGLVREINTSAFADGTAVYASSTGTLVTAVTSSFVGYVTDASAAGHLFVTPQRTDTASGATAARPTTIVTGFPYFDTTLNIPIWWRGAAWVNASGVVV